MDKRYQVFVSSTYEDLRDERQEVMQALLELDCIPCGMELFPAADEDQWSLIRRVIDECDYYIIICAGRYGTIGPSGTSYTEMEYRYAIEVGKPTLAFLHKTPQNLPVAKCEQTDDGRVKLQAFRASLGKKLCKFWEGSSELGSVVSRSLVRQIKQSPGIGWVRANSLIDGAAATEVLRLRRQVEELEAKLAASRRSAPPGTEALSQGAEELSIDYHFGSMDGNGQGWTWNLSVDVSWDEIFYDLGPNLIDETSEGALRASMNRMILARSRHQRSEDSRLTGHTRLSGFQIDDHDYQTIKIQLRALGLITKSEKSRSVKDAGTYWTLTPYGDQVLTGLRAIRRDDEESEESGTEDEESREEV
ncbi:hypothetical protein BKP43_25250 [Variovorax boronicumulans]|uniref:DUF4062 domain-containing protein n=1 Tax=Variovorax boronicumulans TaxID=436515 RepID=UPI000BB2D12A|nr:DUF4062 domain-containing protein [Variovorax boronicumulans]PBI91468.1 hypothetical protein BKP43_25250 [Variovorax boronicumulans]